MAMDGNRLGDAITDYFISVNPRLSGPGSAPYVARLRDRWRAISGLIVAEITTNADVLPAAHAGLSLNNPTGQNINVPALGLLDSHGLPCTGTAATGTTSLLKVIEGKGSVA